VGSDFWTPSNNPKTRLQVIRSFRASLSLRICAPTAPASSRSYGRRSKGAPTCCPVVRGGCRAASSEWRPRLALTPIGGRHLAQGEPSPQAPCPPKKAERPRCQVRNRSARGHGYTPNKGSNPVSRDVAADCLRQADGPPTQGERRAPARFDLFGTSGRVPAGQKNGHLRRAGRSSVDLAGPSS